MDAVFDHLAGFNPSRGIAIIQTCLPFISVASDEMFQSLTRDSNHSNRDNQRDVVGVWWFQSLTRDSNHSNLTLAVVHARVYRFNPSRGIAIIQTVYCAGRRAVHAVSIPHAG